jgi:hypothetical protein
MVDVVPGFDDEVVPTIDMLWRYFDPLTCALDEKCVSGTGWRLLYRFTTDIHNIGTKIYTSESPFVRPDLHVWATCHGHYHMEGFAGFLLYDLDGTLVSTNAKRSYCIESSTVYQSGPNVFCSSEFSCDAQGLEPGWTDRYSRDLDCQWIDVTELYHQDRLGRWYSYFVGVNQRRLITEYSVTNNDVVFPVFLPCAPSIRDSIDYAAYLAANPAVCCGFPTDRNLRAALHARATFKPSP